MIKHKGVKRHLINMLYKSFHSSLMGMIKVNFEPHGKYGKMTSVKHHVNPDKDKPVLEHPHSDVSNETHYKSPLDVPMHNYQELDNMLKYGSTSVSQADKKYSAKLDKLYEDKLKHMVKLLKSDSYKGYAKYWDDDDAWDALGGNDDFGVKSDYNDWEDNLGEFGYQAVIAYCGSKWTYLLNNWLRGTTNPNGEHDKLNEHDTNVIKTIAKHLDKAIASFDLKKPMVVHRQMRIDVLKKFLSAPSGLYREDAYSSTTPVQGSFDLGNVEKLDMIIKVPAGKGIGAWVAPISGCGHENEFLLARGTRFKVTSVDVKKDDNGNPISALMEVVVMPPPKPTKLEAPTEDMDYDTFFQETDDDNDDDKFSDLKGLLHG